MGKPTACTHVLRALAVFCCAACVGTAAPVQDIRTAQKYIEQGAPAEALEMLKELQVDYPESSEVRFSIGCAWFMLGEQHSDAANPAEAQKAFKEALTGFGELTSDPNPVIAREALFNRANCMAREAATMDPAQNHSEAVAALRRAIEAYEAGLKEYPGHEGMRTNLDHVRFQLKQLLQNPPKEQEQPDEQPPDTPPPALVSRFGFVDTGLPGAQATQEEDTAILVIPERKEGQP